MSQFKIAVSPADALSKGREGLFNVAFVPLASDNGKTWNSTQWDQIPENILKEFCEKNHLEPDFVKSHRWNVE